MSEKFPYGYEVNAYIDKAFELMKEEFPWATRDMITEGLYFGIAKIGDDYQYVRYYSQYDGTLSPDPLNIDSEAFIRQLISGHDRQLEDANPVTESFDVPASNSISAGWFLEMYRIRKHQKGGYSTFVQAGNRSAGGSRTFFIPASFFKLPWDEFLDKYLDWVTTGSCFVGRSDLNNCPGLKTFLGF